MTEYFASKTKNVDKEVMLIYGKNLSVSPLTTHLPLKQIFKKFTGLGAINWVSNFKYTPAAELILNVLPLRIISLGCHHRMV